jgi:4-amino-4-deoxy-L-arabinose transferase-like glycosyltransferase
MKFKRGSAQIMALSLILTFWALTIIHIDRVPPLHDDETWILSPGYKLFTAGVFGSDMFTGFHSMEHHYLQFMPLMPTLQGASLLLGGIGAFQMRFVPAALGTLTVALTFAVGRRLLPHSGAILAILFLIFWPWTSPSVPTFTTGIPVLDITRVARYDILAPVLGMAAFLAFIQARLTSRLRYDFAAGILGGLAALSQSYGVFWVVGLTAALLVDRLLSSRPGLTRHLTAFIAGAACMCLPWALILAFNWNDFINQQLMQPERFDMLNARFYLSNLLNEPRRYLYGSPRLIPTGAWLLIAIPAALCAMFVHAQKHRSSRTGWLLTMCTVLALLFALLLQPKGPFYLPSIAVVFALAIAWLITWLNRSRWRSVRVAVGFAVMLTLGYGMFAAIRIHAVAADTSSPQLLMSQLQRTIPATARILGKPPYWLAFPSAEYRSIALVLLASNPERNREAISFEAALAGVAPDYVLLDADTERAMENATSSMWRTYAEGFDAYFRRHNARLLTTLYDNDGRSIKVYQLNQTQHGLR